MAGKRRLTDEERLASRERQLARMREYNREYARRKRAEKGPGPGKGSPGRPEKHLAKYGVVKFQGGSKPGRNVGTKHTYEGLQEKPEFAEVDFEAARARAHNSTAGMATDLEIEAALFKHKGNVTRASVELGYDPDGSNLRRRIRRSPGLVAALDGCLERALDRAISVFWEAMESEHLGLRLSAAKEFLRTEAARRRGFTQRDINVNVSTGPTTVLAWLDDAKPAALPGEDPKLIEGEVAGPGEHPN